jgi:hypothetical protein
VSRLLLSFYPEFALSPLDRFTGWCHGIYHNATYVSQEARVLGRSSCSWLPEMKIYLSSCTWPTTLGMAAGPFHKVHPSLDCYQDDKEACCAISSDRILIHEKRGLEVICRIWCLAVMDGLFDLV